MSISSKFFIIWNINLHVDDNFWEETVSISVAGIRNEIQNRINYEKTLYRRSLEPFVLRTRRIGFRGWRFENRSVRSVEARVWASAFPRGRSVSHRYLSQNKDVWTWNISKNRELKLNHLISKKTHFKPESHLEPRITVPFRWSNLV